MPIKDGQVAESVKFVCPFSDLSADEDEIGSTLFGDISGISHDKYLGYYLENYVGHVNVDTFRRDGSSGGVVTWILSKLLALGEIDGVIHVSPNNDSSDTLFTYTISRTTEDLKNGAKSKYYPVQFSDVINTVLERDGKYAFVGVPCFVKAVRLLMLDNKVLSERILYCIGLVCGHLKSDKFAKALSWEAGIHPNNLVCFDFRVKNSNRSASDYSIEAFGKINNEVVKITKKNSELFSSNWGHGFFKLNACDYCDDVFAETADISIGDAWLDDYVLDPLGNSVVTVRNNKLRSIINEHLYELSFDRVDARIVVESQSGGIRHRREGLAHRLHLKNIQNEYAPKKRVAGSPIANEKRQRIYELRMSLMERSNIAFNMAVEQDDFLVFKREMMPLVEEYNKLYRVPLINRLLAKIKRIIKRMLRR